MWAGTRAENVYAAVQLPAEHLLLECLLLGSLGNQHCSAPEDVEVVLVPNACPRLLRVPCARGTVVVVVVASSSPLSLSDSFLSEQKTVAIVLAVWHA